MITSNIYRRILFTAIFIFTVAVIFMSGVYSVEAANLSKNHWPTSGPYEATLVGAHISFPSNVAPGQPITFNAFISGDDAASTPSASVGYNIVGYSSNGSVINVSNPNLQIGVSGSVTINAPMTPGVYTVYILSNVSGHSSSPAPSATLTVTSPTVNGVCGTAHGGNFYSNPSIASRCSSGTFVNSPGGDLNGWGWRCDGSGPGHADAVCSANRSYNGSCSVSLDSCSIGWPYNTVVNAGLAGDTTTYHRWGCNGINGGTNTGATACTLAKTPASGSISASSCTIPAGGTSCISSVSWSSANFLGSPSVRQGGTTFSTSASSGGTSRSVNPNNRSFSLVDTGSTFVRTTSASVNCAFPSTWSGSSCVVPITNIPPFVNAGPNQLIISPTNSATLAGSATDSDGLIVSRTWTKVSGPAGGVISNASINNPTITGLNNPGVYRYRLTAIDDDGAPASDDMEISVSVSPIVPPNLTFTGSPSTITVGDSTDLTWTVTGAADSCWASGDWSGWKTFIGTNTETLSPTTDATYRLECWNVGVSSGVEEVNVVVNPAASPTATINAPGCTIVAGDSSCFTTVSWSSSNTVGPINVVEETTVFSSSSNEPGVSREIDFGDTPFSFIDNGTVLNSVTARASCSAGTAWDMAAGLCVSVSLADASLNAVQAIPGTTYDSTTGEISGNQIRLNIGNTSVTPIPNGTNINFDVREGGVSGPVVYSGVFITNQLNQGDSQARNFPIGVGYVPGNYPLTVIINPPASIDSNTGNNERSTNLVISLSDPDIMDVDFGVDVIRQGDNANVEVTVESNTFDVTCELGGPGLPTPPAVGGVISGINAGPGNPYNNVFTTGALTRASEYTLTCTEVVSGFSFDPVSAVVEVIPSIQEI